MKYWIIKLLPIQFILIDTDRKKTVAFATDSEEIAYDLTTIHHSCM